VFDALGTLQIYLWVALLNAAILISWARYQQRKSKSYAQRRLPAPVVDDHGLSKSFKLSGDRLKKLRTPGSMTIHNDQEGDITHVVTHFFPITADLKPAPLAPLEHPRVIRLPAEDDTNREPLSHV
jgi:biofilm PGA synthesis protein PgaD